MRCLRLLDYAQARRELAGHCLENCKQDSLVDALFDIGDPTDLDVGGENVVYQLLDRVKVFVPGA